MVEFIVALLLTAVIAAINCVALNLLIGYTGIFSAAQGVFYGLGAYAAALVAMHWGASFFLAALFGILASVAAAVLLALPAARVVGDYFIVVSLAFEVIGVTVFHQWHGVTGGAAGLVGIPRASVFGFDIENNLQYLVLATAVLLLCFLLVRRLVNSPLGRSFKALRDDPLAAVAHGKNPFVLRLIAVILSASISSVAGVIYAGYVGFVNDVSFGMDISFLFITMIILGGAGTLYGPLVGALFITIFPALLNYLDLPPQYLGPVEQLLYGIVLVLLMMLRPDGLVSFADFFRRTPAATAIPAPAAVGRELEEKTHG